MKTPLQTRTSRLELPWPPPEGAKYYKHLIHRGLHLAYRRYESGTASWIAILANGKGGQHEETLGKVDDHQNANGLTVLDFKQAKKAAEAYETKYRDSDGLTDKVPTVDEALTAYAADLFARGQAAVNAQMPRPHLTRAILDQRIDRLPSKLLKAWRDGLVVAGMKPSNVNRFTKPLVTALKQAGWEGSLKALPDATEARKADLTPAQVSAVVAKAYAISDEFGLYVQVHAETGVRSSQIARLTVRDLQLLGDEPRVMMPADRKGPNCARKVRAPTPIPVGIDLASRLAAAAGDRPASDPALLRSNGKRWTESQEHSDAFEKAARAANLPAGTTIYALRHSSIVHQLLKGTPASVVAQWHRTSIPIMAKHYAAYMQDHHDAVIRRNLPNYGPGHNVVQLKACS